MSQRERLRRYSWSMAGMTLTVTAFLFALARIDALAGGPSERVGWAGPVLTIVILLAMIGWCVDALWPNELGDRLPGIFPSRRTRETRDAPTDTGPREAQRCDEWPPGRNSRS